MVRLQDVRDVILNLRYHLGLTKERPLFAAGQLGAERRGRRVGLLEIPARDIAPLDPDLADHAVRASAARLRVGDQDSRSAKRLATACVACNLRPATSSRVRTVFTVSGGTARTAGVCRGAGTAVRRRVPVFALV